MYCLVWRGQVSPDDLAKYVQVFRERLLPQVSRRSGFEGTYLLTKPDGNLMVLHVWETEERFKAWQASGEYVTTMDLLNSLITGTPQQEEYELQAQEIPLRMPFGHP